MYSVVLAALLTAGPNLPGCDCTRNAFAGYMAPAGSPGCCGGQMAAMPAPPCGCPSCDCGAGSPMAVPGPMPFGGMPMMPGQMPTGEMPMPPPGDGTILPPAGLGDGVQPPGAPPMVPTPPVAPQPRLGEAQSSSSQALFVVTLPGDARLLAEGREIPGQGPVRTFLSPPLEPGRDYFYDLAIEVDRSGKVLRDQQTVRFQAGKTANVSFGEPKAETPAPPVTPPAPTKTTRIRVRVPDGAALYVEGRPWATPVVQTPPLDPTRTHYYLLTVEVIRDGRRAVQTREVAFRAGQELTVDFTAPPPAAAHVAKNSR